MKVWPEKLSNDGTNNYKLLMLSIKNDFNLQHIYSMDEEEVSLCQAGMIFTKDLSNCKSEYEFAIKPNTGICPQGLLWNMVDEKKCGEQKTIFFKSLEEKKIQNFPNYEKQYSKNLNFLKVEIESMEKECLLPILQLPNFILFYFIIIILFYYYYYYYYYYFIILFYFILLLLLLFLLIKLPNGFLK